MTSARGHSLVSVIVPAWNAERTLAETLQSVGAQTYRNVEIIIVDDGSTDATADVARGYCARDARARLVQQENRGLSDARNRGIEESAGEWIAPIDADDLWHSTKLEKQVRAALEAAERPGFVYCWYRDIDEEGLVLGSGPSWIIEGPAFKRLAYLNTIHTLLLSRDAVLSVGGYDRGLRACEDVMIHLQIARRYPVAVVPEYLLGYRKRADSMSRDTDLVIRSWRSVHRTLISEGAEMPSRVIRWSEAFFDMVLAEQRAGAGSYREALPPLLRALRHDPAKWSRYLGYRIVRTALRLARGRRPVGESLHFDDVSPVEFIPSDPDALPWLAERLRRFDEKRLGRLARMEKLEPTGRDATR